MTNETALQKYGPLWWSAKIWTIVGGAAVIFSLFPG
jgi:hypothetical protein